jgi:hypothetical protein
MGWMQIKIYALDLEKAGEFYHMSWIGLKMDILDIIIMGLLL